MQFKLTTVLERAGRKILKVHNIFVVFLVVIVCLKVGNEVKTNNQINRL